MNCEVVQRRLLSSDAPQPPPGDVRRHLAECPTCRAWQRRLAQLEVQLPLLAVPPSQRKAEVLRRILDGPVPLNGTARVVHRSSFTTPARDRGLLKVSAAIALAAALVLFALGIGLWQLSSKPVKPVDPLAARRLDRDRRLAEATTPRGHVETLARIADDAHGEALALARHGDADKLANLSKFYVELVRDNLVEYANQLAPELRRGVLDVIAARLIEMESELQRTLAGDMKSVNKPALQEMAVAARTSHDQLLALLSEPEA